VHQKSLRRIIRNYTARGIRNRGRPLKRLLVMWERNGSRSGPKLW